MPYINYKIDSKDTVAIFWSLQFFTDVSLLVEYVSCQLQAFKQSLHCKVCRITEWLSQTCEEAGITAARCGNLYKFNSIIFTNDTDNSGSVLQQN